MIDQLPFTGLLFLNLAGWAVFGAIEVWANNQWLNDKLFRREQRTPASYTDKDALLSYLLGPIGFVIGSYYRGH